MSNGSICGRSYSQKRRSTRDWAMNWPAGVANCRGSASENYVFDGPAGRETLSQLFAGRSQLAVYHFMFSPEWEEGCPHCSFWADNFNGIDIHLAHRDVTFVAISHAPLSKLEAFKRRMDW